MARDPAGPKGATNGHTSPDRRKAQLPDRLRYKPMGAAYQGAMESVFAIAIATAAGWWADRHFGTSPVWLLVGATIGFGAFVLRLYRLGATLNESAAEETSSAPPAPRESPDANDPASDEPAGNVHDPDRQGGSGRNQGPSSR